MCGGAYALKRWLPPHDQHDWIRPPDEPGPSSSSSSTTRIVTTQHGEAEIIGVREGEWFRAWEGTIRRAVLDRLHTDSPFLKPDDVPLSENLIHLDGY